MNSQLNPDAGTERRSQPCRYVRWAGWALAILLGGAQAWTTRFTINPDGISYLDIGDAFWRGDFRATINAWWSPVYAIVVGFFVKVLKPNAYWEYPLVHLVNFLIYLVALACFELFLTAFIRIQTDDKNANVALPILSEWEWRILGYTLFTWTSLQMITLGLVTPDLCIAAIVYLSTAMLLHFHSGKGAVNIRTSVAFGLVLGLGYWVKAVMFPLAFVFLAAAAVATAKSGKSSKRLLTSAGVFFLVSAPLVGLLSSRAHRFSFGDSGRIDYAVFINGVDVFIPTGQGVKHPVHQLSVSPPAYAYGMDGPYTYPLWFDPSYWHEGIAPRFSLSRQLHTIYLAFLWYAALLFHPLLGLNITAAVLGLYLLSPQPSQGFQRIARHWPLLATAFVPLCLYSLIVVEYRFLGAFMCVLWLVAFAGVSGAHSRPLEKVVAAVVIVTCLTTIALCIRANVIHAIEAKQSVMYSEAARALANYGLHPGDKLAVIADEPFGKGGAFVARLARSQIVAEIRNPDLFWKASPTDRKRVLSSFEGAGAKATLLYRNGSWDSSLSPQRLGLTPYYFIRSSQLHDTR